jgi:outer membrane receptor protein involved in Fe transport
VTGLRRSLQGAQAIKRDLDQIVDAIVAEDIGKLPDNNAAESLARITGVQVTRSLGARFRF